MSSTYIDMAFTERFPSDASPTSVSALDFNPSHASVADISCTSSGGRRLISSKRGFSPSSLPKTVYVTPAHSITAMTMTTAF